MLIPLQIMVPSIIQHNIHLQVVALRGYTPKTLHLNSLQQCISQLNTDINWYHLYAEAACKWLSKIIIIIIITMHAFKTDRIYYIYGPATQNFRAMFGL
jgi:hypothetical protein